MDYDNNPQLKLAYDFVQFTGKNIFLTGKAGTGKTTFLHNLKATSHKRLVVVAPTGVAAINAKGVTIHSFFQLSFGPQIPGAETASASAASRRFSKEKINIIRSMDLLVIDEISMVRADLLDGIDNTLRRFRNKHLPFGGVQLLMIGDLQQLAPVVKDDEWNMLRDYYDTAFFFSSNALKQTKFVSVELLHVYRQSDEKFIKLLNCVRDNKIDDSVIDALNARYNPNFDTDNAGYIILTTHNAKAKQINESRLNLLKTKSHSFKANVSGNFPEYTYPTDFELILKKGAQVMFVKNDPNPEKRYYNGKIGKIIDIDKGALSIECEGNDELIKVGTLEWEKMKYTLDDKTKEIKETVEGVFSQYPVKLAWAITIHKSQGLTFENAVIDAQSAFAHGQVYVALSRCKTLEGLVLSSPIQRQSVKHDSTINSFTKNVEDNQPDNEQLNMFKNEFQLDLLFELFDFTSISTQLHYTVKLFQDHYSAIQNNPVDEFTTISKAVNTEIVTVANKFKNQLQQLFIQNSELENNEALQTRIIKAVPYFLSKMTGIIKEPIFNFVIETDNKVAKKSLKNNFEKLHLDYNIKYNSLLACTKGFVVDDYLKARAHSTIEDAKKSSVKTKSTGKSGSKSELLDTLKAWRDARAEELNWEVYRVIQLKTIHQLCKHLPHNPSALSAIDGMGRVKMKMFSDELLDIINDYREENNILKEDTAKLKLHPEKKKKEPKVNSKELSFNLFNSGKTVAEIAKERGYAVSTIEGHLVYFVDLGKLTIEKLVEKDKVKVISEYMLSHEFVSLKETFDGLKQKYSYSELKLVLHQLLFEKKIKRPKKEDS